MQRVSVLDLTVDQIEQIERESGLALEQWTTPAGRVRAFRYIYAVATGTTPEAVGHMTLRELTDAIALDDDDPVPAEPP